LGAREKLQLEHKLVALLDVGLPSDCLLVPPLHQQKNKENYLFEK
jgi:hypothetical protein